MTAVVPRFVPFSRTQLWLALAAVVGVCLLLYYTRTGVGVRGDSIRYVMGARNLLAGDGFSRTSGGGEVFPETGFAPLLAFVLAGMGLLGVDLFTGAQVMNVVLFGVNGILVGGMVHRFTRSTVAAILTTLLFLIAPSLLEWHGWLMTEALFIFLTLLSISALVRYLDGGPLRFLILSGILAGAGGLTRYVGLCMAPAGALAILGWGPGSRGNRWLQAFGFGLLVIAPFAAWMVRNQVVGDPGLANREILLHAIRPDLLRQYLFEAATWVVPAVIRVPRMLRASLAILAVVAGPAAYAWRIRTRGPAESPVRGVLPWVCALYLGNYLLVLVLNSFLLDAGTGAEAAVRYLAPFLAVLLVLEVSTYAVLILEASRAKMVAGVGLVGSGVLLALYAQQSLMLAQASTAAQGFTGIRQRWSAAAADLNRLAGDQPIISNNPEMVYYLIGRPAYILPIKFDVYRLVEREDFPEQLRLATERIGRGSVVAMLGEPKPVELEVLALLPVVPFRTYEGVIIYGGTAPEAWILETPLVLARRSPSPQCLTPRAEVPGLGKWRKSTGPLPEVVQS